MNILIDTHVVLWALTNPKKLTAFEHEILLAPTNTVYVSAISIWEISLKHSIGKLRIQPFDITTLITGIHDSNFYIIPLTGLEASGFDQQPHTINTDPFDRMLCWQAISNNYYFMSRDKKIPAYQKLGLKLVTEKTKFV